MSNNDKLLIGFGIVVLGLLGGMIYLFVFEGDGTGNGYDPYAGFEEEYSDNPEEPSERKADNRIDYESNSDEQTSQSQNPVEYTEQIAPTRIDLSRYAQVMGRVVDESKRPVSRAKVILYREKKTKKRIDDLERSPAIEAVETFTDFEGNYVFSNVTAPARFELIAEAEGHVCNNRPEVRVFPKKSQKVPDIILGKGWELTGRVKDNRGRAIEGAEVFFELDSGDKRVLDWLLEDGEGTTKSDGKLNDEKKLYLGSVLKRNRTVCDSNGRFDLGMVAAGKYRVGAMADGYSMVINKNVITEESKRKTGIKVDIVLEPAEVIRGLVIDTDQVPIEGVEIRAERDKDKTTFSLARATSASSGQFTLKGLHPGRYIVSARKKGFLPAFATNVEAGAPNITLVMPKAASCIGKVVAADTGKPLKDFSVGICSKPVSLNHELRDAIRPWEHFSNKSGRFKLEGMQRGNYVLVARADGYGLGQSAPFALKDSEEMGPLTISLPKGYTLKGHIEDLRSSPVSGALVALQPGSKSGSAQVSRLFGVQPASMADEGDKAIHPCAKTDDKGEFVITNAMQGVYLLKITHPDYETLVVPAVTVDMKKTNYAGKLALTQGSTLECTVFSRWGKPEPRALMLVKGNKPDNFYLVRTDEYGLFKIINLAPGEYTISLRSGGGAASNPIKSAAEGKRARSTSQKVFLEEGMLVTTEFHLR